MKNIRFFYLKIFLFLVVKFSIYLNRHVFRNVLPNYESTGPSVQEKKRKIDFQDGRHGSHSGFPIGMISAIFDASYQVLSQ